MIMGVCRRFSLIFLSHSLLSSGTNTDALLPNHSPGEKSINRENVSLVREHIVVVVDVVVLTRKYF